MPMPKGFKHSEETKRKMSVAGKGKKKSEEHKQKISEALKGREVPWMLGKKRPEHSEKMKGEKNYFYGKKHSVETREKISKTKIEREQSKGENNANWRGGRRINYGGYVLIWKPDHPYAEKNGTVFEHRLVVEKALGRFLKSDEKVHHINGDRLDNRPCNLLVCTNSYHASLEARIRYSKEITQ